MFSIEPKKSFRASSSSKKKARSIIEMKKIQKYETNNKIAETGCTYRKWPSTISSIMEKSKAIKEANVSTYNK